MKRMSSFPALMKFASGKISIFVAKYEVTIDVRALLFVAILVRIPSDSRDPTIK